MTSLMKVEVLLIMKLTVICEGNAYLLYTFTLKEKTFTNETFAFSLFFYAKFTKVNSRKIFFAVIFDL